MKHHIIDLIFPKRCPICGDIMEAGARLACPICKLKAPYVTTPYCLKCGKPIADAHMEYCTGCMENEPLFTQGRALFRYTDQIKKSIYSYKYGNRREYAAYYTEEIIRLLGDDIRRWRADAIIPIPIHKERAKKRGFNQAELIAGMLGRNMQIPVCSDYVIREKNTIAQKNLNREERQNNLKRAFKITQNDVKLEEVIL
ncbi:MAG: ComF family protein, partial [Clostridia bacterium]|nr:ComF family protein [Clostridia bacterium]